MSVLLVQQLQWVLLLLLSKLGVVCLSAVSPSWLYLGHVGNDVSREITQDKCPHLACYLKI